MDGISRLIDVVSQTETADDGIVVFFIKLCGRTSQANDRKDCDALGQELRNIGLSSGMSTYLSISSSIALQTRGLHANCCFGFCGSNDGDINVILFASIYTGALPSGKLADRTIPVACTAPADNESDPSHWALYFKDTVTPGERG
jgi:hypothetical protein